MLDRVVRLDPATERVRELLEPHVVREGFELLWLEYKNSARGGLLRIFADRPGGGITLDELEELSQVLGRLLDVYDPFESSYVLEVSSPGINRPLVRLGDFEACRGLRVKIRTRVPLEGRRSFSGRLENVDSEGIELSDAASGEARRIAFAAICSANYEHDFNAGRGSKGAKSRNRG